VEAKEEANSKGEEEEAGDCQGRFHGMGMKE
jgi:hypothetical protein